MDPLNSLNNKFKNLTPLMKVLAATVQDCVRENFGKEGRPGWASLSKRTIKERTKLGYWPGKILQRTGALKRSITSKHDSTSVTVGTNKIYAPIHQFGGIINIPPHQRINHFKKYKSGKVRFAKIKKSNFAQKNTVGGYQIKIPARPFMTLTQQDIDSIKQKILNYLM